VIIRLGQLPHKTVDFGLFATLIGHFIRPRDRNQVSSKRFFPAMGRRKNQKDLV
jgi:hypothetical protein